MEWFSKQLKDFWLFIQSIPATLRESFIWLVMTYSFPILQVGIILGIKRMDIEWSLDILNILLVANASLYTSVFFEALNTKRRRFFKVLLFISYLVSFVLFAFSMAEITKGIELLPIDWYVKGTAGTTLFVSVHFSPRLVKK